MRWYVPAAGLLIGWSVVNTDVFQRAFFPASYWSREVAELEKTIRFTEAELDDARQLGDVEMEAIFAEALSDFRNDLERARGFVGP